MSNINREYWSDKTTMVLHDELRDWLKSQKIRKGEPLESVIKRMKATIEENDLDIITEEILQE